MIVHISEKLLNNKRIAQGDIYLEKSISFKVMSIFSSFNMLVWDIHINTHTLYA